MLYRLIQADGAGKERTVRVFGYSGKNNLWVRILGLNKSETTFIPEIASEVEETIAAWGELR
jgi:hypothetical protein